MNEIAVQLAEIFNGKKLSELTATEHQVVNLITPLYLTVTGRGIKKLAKTEFATQERGRIWEDTVTSLGR